MPSQITHTLCAEESLPPSHRLVLDDPVLHGWLAFGAQGPDIFYHNQRRVPRSVQYGTLLHRHGYGYVTAAIMEAARVRNEGNDGPTGAYVAGFVSHAVLDRVLHPYINFKSGRPVSGRPETDRLRSMHPFLERLIDVALLQELRGVRPREFGFFQIIEPLEPALQGTWVGMMEQGLSRALSRAATDEKLTQRMHNAWLDAFGYYRFTQDVDEVYLQEALKREQYENLHPHWLSIVHPPNVPADVDVLNIGHKEWTHPCSSKRTSVESVVEMYDRAVRQTRDLLTDLFHAWNHTDQHELTETVVSLVGDYNLSDGRPRKRPCSPRHMDPLPLPELQQAIKESVRAGHGGVVESLGKA